LSQIMRQDTEQMQALKVYKEIYCQLLRAGRTSAGNSQSFFSDSSLSLAALFSNYLTGYGCFISLKTHACDLLILSVGIISDGWAVTSLLSVCYKQACLLCYAFCLLL
jgi:hypothetical protein